jgi:hypothetical protein
MSRLSVPSFESATGATAERRLNVKLLSEIDNVVSRARAALVTSPRGLLNLPYAPNDLREQARLCMEESEAATETAVSHPFASRALLLAQLAEVIAVRLKHEPSKSRPSQSIADSIGTSN